MEREIIKIDRDKCNGCGVCVPNCHEGALQIIDGKAVMVSELMCDGLGACINHCPQDAITIETREAEAYDEILTIKEMIPKGKNTIIAHLQHMKEYNELEYLRQGVQYLEEHKDELDFDLGEVKYAVHNMIKKNNTNTETNMSNQDSGCGGGCPGSQAKSFSLDTAPAEEQGSLRSALTQWPVQLHLVNPNASYFQGSDLLIAADCVAFSLGEFHQKWLKGRSLAIACPKLDDGLEIYTDKIRMMIDEAKVNTITLMIMEVPCCGGLHRIVKSAVETASRKVPVKLAVVGIQGDILSEEWV